MASSTVESTEDSSNVHSFLAASDSCIAASVLAEELLFIEHRLAWELDGERTRCCKASEERRCDDCVAEWLKSQAGPLKAGELGPVLGFDDCSYSASRQDSEQYVVLSVCLSQQARMIQLMERPRDLVQAESFVG
ncbi:hypothetical protein FJTKL_11140 [Diaporthe vaccinii]|uniref:Uncharacterized protein n=1 Tax=Diaporthe vaccinii TaxID=105482 RepID=A0ABR4EI87_9PEZI